MHRDPAVMATLGGVRSDAVTAAYLEGVGAHWERHGFGYWLFRDAAGRFVGRGGLRRVSLEGAEEVELAYALMPDFWGQGLAVEIAEAALRLAFGELKLADVVAFTLPDNHRSRRVMEKVGFVFERAITYKDLPHVLYRRRAFS